MEAYRSILKSKAHFGTDILNRQPWKIDWTLLFTIMPCNLISSKFWFLDEIGQRPQHGFREEIESDF